MPIESDPRLDDVALGTLAAAVAGAFDPGDLEEAVLAELDQNLYADYAPAGTAPPALALALVQGLKQRGWVVRFLRGARRRRPDNAPLLAAIRQLCPAAMQDEPSAGAAVDAVLGALAEIRARLSDSQVASAVGGSRADLGSLADGLARLRVYKSLHDVLQKCQVSQFSDLADSIRRLRTDPQASVMLRNQLLDLRMTFDRARRDLGPLEASADDVEEKGWIDDVAATLDEIGRARDRLDDRAARIAARKIRDQLKYQPSRINGLLRSQARRLPLRRLSEAIAEASRTAGLSAPQRAAFDSGVGAVTELRLRLERQVADHDRWQRVEGSLWFIDEIVERSTSSTDEFADYWQIAKESILPLWSADASAAWVVATRAHGVAIDAALAADPPEAPRARSVYGDFRYEALWQFYRVDGELSQLCETVVRIGTPVAALLEGGA